MRSSMRALDSDYVIRIKKVDPKRADLLYSDLHRNAVQKDFHNPILQGGQPLHFPAHPVEQVRTVRTFQLPETRFIGLRKSPIVTYMAEGECLRYCFIYTIINISMQVRFS